MKRFVVVLMMLMVAVAAFAETASERVARTKAEKDAAWNELLNYKSLSWDEFKAEYKKNHFALNNNSNEWSASLSKAFKEYQEEVKQQQKELWAIYNEAYAKYKEASKAEMDELLKGWK